MSAAGKKSKLKMKYPMKLRPFRLATRAGQNAIAIQIRAHKIHNRKYTARSLPRSHRTLLFAAVQQRYADGFTHGGFTQEPAADQHFNNP
jgi:hypothetical protein